jgi:hypothetical protein
MVHVTLLSIFACMTGGGEELNTMAFVTEIKKHVDCQAAKQSSVMMWLWYASKLATMFCSSTAPSQCQGIAIEKDECN